MEWLRDLNNVMLELLPRKVSVVQFHAPTFQLVLLVAELQRSVQRDRNAFYLKRAVSWFVNRAKERGSGQNVEVGPFLKLARQMALAQNKQPTINCLIKPKKNETMMILLKFD